MSIHLGGTPRRRHGGFLAVALGVGLIAFALLDSGSGEDGSAPPPSTAATSEVTVLGSVVTRPAVSIARGASPATFAPSATTAGSPGPSSTPAAAPSTTAAPPPSLVPPVSVVAPPPTRSSTSTTYPTTTTTTLAEDPTSTTEATTTTSDPTSGTTSTTDGSDPGDG